MGFHPFSHRITLNLFLKQLLGTTRILVPFRDSRDGLPSLEFSAQAQLFSRPTAATPGDPFINLFPANFQRRRSQPANGTRTDTISVGVEILRMYNNDSPSSPFQEFVRIAQLFILSTGESIS